LQRIASGEVEAEQVMPLMDALRARLTLKRASSFVAGEMSPIFVP
jgi:hypothetical protein